MRFPEFAEFFEFLIHLGKTPLGSLIHAQSTRTSPDDVKMETKPQTFTNINPIVRYSLKIFLGLIAKC